MRNPLRREAADWVIPSEWRGLVVICSGTSWDGARLSDRHLAERMSVLAPVLFVDPPISWATPLVRPELRGSALTTGLTRVSARIARLTPLAPPGVSRPGLRLLALKASRAAMSRAVHQLGGDVRAVITGSLDDVFGACHEELSVLWGTDDFAAAGSLMGLSPQWLKKREADQLAKADVITAVSDALAQAWRAMGYEVTVIPNGCDTAHYASCETATVPTDVRLKAPIATFIGHLSERIDMATLEAVARTGHSLLLVGPRQPTFQLQRIEALLRLPNVQWVGPRPFSALPSYLRVTDVGLTPYADTPFNRASFPLKTLEYLAAGKPVVSTDLPAARWLGTELVQIADSPESFAATAAALLTAPPDPDFPRRARDFAAGHDWQVRAEEMAELLNLRRSRELRT